MLALGKNVRYVRIGYGEGRNKGKRTTKGNEKKKKRMRMSEEKKIKQKT